MAGTASPAHLVSPLSWPSAAPVMWRPRVRVRAVTSSCHPRASSCRVAIVLDPERPAASPPTTFSPQSPSAISTPALPIASDQSQSPPDLSDGPSPDGNEVNDGVEEDEDEPDVDESQVPETSVAAWASPSFDASSVSSEVLPSSQHLPSGPFDTATVASLVPEASQPLLTPGATALSPPLPPSSSPANPVQAVSDGSQSASPSPSLDQALGHVKSASTSVIPSLPEEGGPCIGSQPPVSELMSPSPSSTNQAV